MEKGEKCKGCAACWQDCDHATAPLSTEFIGCADLPVYVSTTTPEERLAKLAFMREQVDLILDQEKLGMAVTKVKVRCGCHKLLPLIYMYRCLYCGLYYCKKCAEVHFGMRVPPSTGA